MNRQLIKISVLLTSLFIMLLSFSSVQAQQRAHYNTYVSSNCNGFYDFKPSGYDPSGTKLYPVIIFVHGSWEYGSGSTSSLPKVLKHGPPHVIANGQWPSSFTYNSQTYKFIVFSPQFRSSAGASSINDIINYVINHYKVDKSRIYLTGLSSGGGTVEAAAADPTVGKRIAAVIPMAGTNAPSVTKAANIITNKVAYWGIHNKYDDVVPYTKTTTWVSDILSVNSGAPAKKTIPSASGHNCWTSRYVPTWTENGLSLYQWMLKYKRGTTTTTSTSTTATKIEAENYYSMSGVTKETTTDAGGGQNLSGIDQGDWVKYANISIKTSGTYTFTFRLASARLGAKFNVYDTYNSVKTLVKTITVPETGSWQTWKSVTASISLKAGTHTFVLSSTATPHWNINYFKFALGTTTSTELDADAATETVSEEGTTTSALTVAPDQFSDRFVVSVNNPYTGMMKVQLISASGVVSKEFKVTKSATGTMQTYLSAGTLTKGTYFVKVTLGEWTQTSQIEKL